MYKLAKKKNTLEVVAVIFSFSLIIGLCFTVIGAVYISCNIAFSALPTFGTLLLVCLLSALNNHILNTEGALVTFLGRQGYCLYCIAALTAKPTTSPDVFNQ